VAQRTLSETDVTASQTTISGIIHHMKNARSKIAFVWLVVTLTALGGPLLQAQTVTTVVRFVDGPPANYNGFFGYILFARDWATMLAFLDDKPSVRLSRVGLSELTSLDLLPFSADEKAAIDSRSTGSDKDFYPLIKGPKITVERGQLRKGRAVMTGEKREVPIWFILSGDQRCDGPEGKTYSLTDKDVVGFRNQVQK
jgi:hypothetical protein